MRDQREHVEVARDAAIAQPRTKNGQPAHSTTGVAKANWIQFDSVGLEPMCRPTMRRPFPAPTPEREREADPEPARHVGELGIGAAVGASAISGSSAMPQIGQAPGPTWRISGCIGQV